MNILHSLFEIAIWNKQFVYQIKQIEKKDKLGMKIQAKSTVLYYIS